MKILQKKIRLFLLPGNWAISLKKLNSLVYWQKWCSLSHNLENILFYWYELAYKIHAYSYFSPVCRSCFMSWVIYDPIVLNELSGQNVYIGMFGPQMTSVFRLRVWFEFLIHLYIKMANMNVTILENVRKMDTIYRREREKYHIRKFNTFYEGMNKTP